MDQPQKPKTEESTPKVLPPVKKPISRSPMARKIRTGKIIKALMDGKTLKGAAISAGYAENSAGAQASALLKHPDAKQAFAHVMEREGITDEFLARKIRRLLSAKEVKFFQKDGKVIESRTVNALETQRKTAELATKLKGHLKDRSEVDVNIGLMAMVVAAVKTGSGDDDGGENE